MASTVDPVQTAITKALKDAKNTVSYSATPEQISGWQQTFIPGVDYTKYFDAIISAETAANGANTLPVAEWLARKAVWSDWQKTHSSAIDTDLSSSGGKTLADLQKQVADSQKLLDAQTDAIKKSSTDISSATNALNSANTALYGKGGTADKPASKSLALQYNANLTTLNNPKASVKDKAKASAALYGTGTADKPAPGSLADNYTKAVDAQKTASSADTTAKDAFNPLLYSSIQKTIINPKTQFDNFLSGVPVDNSVFDLTGGTGTTGGTGSTGTTTTPADPNAVKIAKAMESYKLTGAIPSNIDSSILGQVQKAIDEYETKKQNDAIVTKNAAIAAKSPVEVGKVQSDIADYNKAQSLAALIAKGAQGAPKIGETTTDVVNKMRLAKGEEAPATGAPINKLTDFSGRVRDALGQSGPGAVMKQPQTMSQTPYQNWQPQAQPTSQVPQLGLNLSQDYNTRMIQQDLAANQELQHPGTYANSQFDPFYSGYLTTRGMYQNPNTPINFMGFGAQNAYDPNVYNPPANVTGKAAGGYLDAQSIGQNNQALQQQPQLNTQQTGQQDNNQLGIASIPNMSQYTNYTGNPGITSPTQNTDDGGVGGVSVFGQTNPVW